MAFADPQSITIAGSAKSLPLILREGSHSVYRLSDLTLSLDIRHRNVKRNKKNYVVSTAQLIRRKIVADPLTAAQDYESNVWSLMNDRPEVGFTNTELLDDLAGFQGWQTASSSAAIVKMIGQET